MEIDIEALNKTGTATLVENLGIEFLEPQDGMLRARMPVDERTRQPMGILHGGASVALAETLGSTASYLKLDSKKFFPVGLAINANHVRSTRSGYVVATARELHIGRTTHIWEIEVTQNEKLICVCRLTMAIRDVIQNS